MLLLFQLSRQLFTLAFRGLKALFQLVHVLFQGFHLGLGHDQLVLATGQFGLMLFELGASFLAATSLLHARLLEVNQGLASLLVGGYQFFSVLLQDLKLALVAGQIGVLLADLLNSLGALFRMLAQLQLQCRHQTLQLFAASLVLGGLLFTFLKSIFQHKHLVLALEELLSQLFGLLASGCQLLSDGLPLLF